jgi:acyl-coenzyme A thioesterase PaaI-like protein
MTDIPSQATSVPSRLGTTARFEDGRLLRDLTPRPEVLHHGMIRASVLSFAIDAVAGISVDGDETVWTLTSDMTVRMRPVPAPALVTATNTIVRQGSRSVTSVVEVVADDGSPVATGAIGFVNIARRADAPPKPIIPLDQAPRLFAGQRPITRPLREEAGIEVVDPAEGVVQIELTPDVLNPAGTLQGAMVALVGEAAAEDLVATRFESPVVVTDLDLRYLAQTGAGPVRTRSRLLGSGPEASVQVELIDTSTDRLTTLVYARAVAAEL